jgi:hypothetical protein
MSKDDSVPACILVSSLLRSLHEITAIYCEKRPSNLRSLDLRNYQTQFKS